MTPAANVTEDQIRSDQFSELLNS